MPRGLKHPITVRSSSTWTSNTIFGYRHRQGILTPVTLRKEVFMPNGTLRDQIILDEIKGKNQAIQAYDGILWKIRPGYLTIIFAGWGFLLKGVLDKIDTFPTWAVNLDKVVVPTLLISIGLCIGALIIDLGFVWRKFRVIAALNELLPMCIMEWAPEKTGDSSKAVQGDLERLMQVSGYVGEVRSMAKGAAMEVAVSVLLYLVPILAILSGLRMSGLI